MRLLLSKAFRMRLMKMSHSQTLRIESASAVKEGLQPTVSWPSKAEPEVREQNASAKAAWAQIQQRMKPPLCKGHSEPCVIRQVKKGGPNQGKPATLCMLGHMLLPCSCLRAGTRSPCCCASGGSSRVHQHHREDSPGTVQPDNGTGAAKPDSTCIKKVSSLQDQAPDQPGAAQSRCTFITSGLMVTPEGDGEPCINSWPLAKLKRGHQGDLWPASSSCAAPWGCVIMRVRWETVSISITAGAGRVFFVCRRAAGNLPEGRCDFFQWEGDRQLRGSRAQGAAKSVTLKGCWN